MYCVLSLFDTAISDYVRGAKKEEVLRKAATIAHQHHAAVHPIVFRGPHPVRDEALLTISG